MPGKIDLYARYRKEYAAPRAPVLLTVGAAKYLTVTGRGDPNGPAFGAAVGALYGIAFTIKMARKQAGRDFTVAKLESLWWGGRSGRLLIDSPVGTWRWKVMIRVPPFVAARDVVAARRALTARGRASPATVRIETLREGKCVQTLHRGPYRAEHATIADMIAFARARGLRPRGRHHEIYLSDPRRVAPAKLRTILRQPVR